MFIVFEGPDGSGKTTQMRLLRERLEGSGIATVASREPGGTELGNSIRDALLGRAFRPDRPHPELEPYVWALLMNSARAHLVHTVLEPSLSAGNVVLLDRYWYSTVAYQSGGDGIPFDEVVSLCHLATGGLEPDIAVLLDIAPDDALQRKSTRLADIMDKRPVQYHDRVMGAYRGLIEANPKPWLVVDAKQAKEEVHRAIWNSVFPQVLTAKLGDKK